jgi:uncharacterized SAM-binding protein YcdF (DUF218 family)
MEPQTGRGAADLAPPRPSPWARLGVALGAILCLWVGGFLYFVGTLPKTVENPDGETDAIIVLTGGTERLDTGVDLLRDGKAKMLLISGVDRATTRDELQVRSRLDPDKFACCVKLGREASDTVGNAIEAELWMRRGGYTSLRLVTASYHMPRSLLLFRSTLKGVSVIAHPVFPENVKADEWWLYPGTARLLAAEFAKYLVSLLTVRLAAAEDAPAPSQ